MTNKELSTALKKAIDQVDEEYFNDEDYSFELNYIPERVGEIMQKQFGDRLWIEGYWMEDIEDSSLSQEHLIETVMKACMAHHIEAYTINRDTTHDIVYVALLTKRD